MPDSLASLIEPYLSQGLILDTNLLIVYMVGSVAPEKVGQARRTEGFTRLDAAFLIPFVDRFTRKLTTPAILAETYNLLEPFRKSLTPAHQASLDAILKNHVHSVEERHVSARTLIDDPDFSSCGFTDSAIKHIAHEGYAVLTVDVQLWALLAKRKLPCFNYNHHRHNII